MPREAWMPVAAIYRGNVDSVDLQVLKQLCDWLAQGRAAWLCTIVKTHGASPRPVGSLLACDSGGHTVGSLSGGCIEDDLLEKIRHDQLAHDAPRLHRYGITAEENERLGLPCGGTMEVLIEPVGMRPEQAGGFNHIVRRLAARQCVERVVDIANGAMSVRDVAEFAPLRLDSGGTMTQTFGPRFQLLLIGAGQLAQTVAQMALMMDYRVLVCDPRKPMIEQWPVANVQLTTAMPDDAVREHASDAHSIVLTLTHDPRIDDMALMEALTTDAFYIGALGSQRTSQQRRARLLKLGLTEAQIARLHAPVGLDIGSKTPAEIAIAILADLTKQRRGKAL